MSNPAYLRQWSVWCLGSHLANAVEYTPPTLAVVEAEWRAGHMDMPITLDDGMEAMTVTLKLQGVDESILPMFGFQAGLRPRISVREGYSTATGQTELVDEIEGIITRYEPDARTETDRAKTGLMVTIKPHFYKRSRNGIETICIIPAQGVRRINGIDQLGTLSAFVMGRK